MKKLAQTRKREIFEGLAFTAPYIIGVIAFFAFPIVFSVAISLGSYQITENGFALPFIGFENYITLFTQDINFTEVLKTTSENTLINTPLIVVFSMIISVILNKSMLFRSAFRTIFFLPFLLGSGFVMKQLLQLGVSGGMMDMANDFILPKGIMDSLNPGAWAAVFGFLNRITGILWKSGVQIILFLSALQSISKSLYESAMVDSATEWEMFWKITMPMITPITLLVIIYTIVDSFTDPANPMMELFFNAAFKSNRFSLSAAMSWVYFIMIMLIIGAVFLFMRKRIHNELER